MIKNVEQVREFKFSLSRNHCLNIKKNICKNNITFSSTLEQKNGLVKKKLLIKLKMMYVA